MATELLDKLKNNVSDATNKLSNNISKVSNQATNNINNLTSNITKNDTVQNLTSNVKDNFSNVTSNVTNHFNNIGEKIMNTIPYDSANYLTSSAQFINSNNAIAKIIFIILTIILFITLFKIGFAIISFLITPNPNPFLYKDMKDAKHLVIIPQNPNAKDSVPILRSRNQYDGIEFTYSTWIYIDDPTYRENQTYKHIFHKGNDYLGNDYIYYPNNSPGLYLYNGTENHIENPGKLDSYDYKYPIMSLLVRMNIFTNESDKDKDFYEDINIHGIPIKKWVNVIVRVNNQNIVDVFINGKIMKRKKLSGIVRQNYDNIYINMNGGFSGYLSSLRYFNYALGSFEISTLVSNGPSLKMESSNIAQSKPKYLSSKWFFSESSPTFN